MISLASRHLSWSGNPISNFQIPNLSISWFRLCSLAKRLPQKQYQNSAGYEQYKLDVSFKVALAVSVNGFASEIYAIILPFFFLIPDTISTVFLKKFQNIWDGISWLTCDGHVSEIFGEFMNSCEKCLEKLLTWFLTEILCNSRKISGGIPERISFF